MHPYPSVRAAFLALLVGALSCSSPPASGPLPEAPRAASPPAGPAPTAAPQQAPAVAPAGAATASMAYPTGDRATSALLIEKFAPAEIVVGAPLVWELRITNLTSLALQNVVVTDRIPSNMRVSSTEPAAQSSGDALRWNFDVLPPRAARSLRVSGSATGPGLITSCADVTYNTALCVTTRVVEPKLELAKFAPAEVLLCDPIPVRFVVTNKGSGAARDVRIVDELPEGLVTADGLRAFSLPVGSVPAGEAREVAVTLRAQRTGSFVNRASASAEGGLKADSGSTSTRVVQPVLQLVKSGPEVMYAGRSITWVLEVSNTGDGPARNLIVEDVVPAGLKVERATEGATLAGDRVQWRPGTLEPRASRRLELVVATSAPVGLVRNSAVAKADCAEAVTAAADTRVEGIAAILLEVIDLSDPIQVGQSETYEITVTNQGSAPDTDIRLVCRLDRGMQFVSATGPTSGAASGSTVTLAPLASLAPGAKATWRVVIRGTEDGDLRFGVSLNSAQLTRSVEETEATHFYR